MLFTDILNCSRQSLYLDKDMLLDKTKSSLACGVLRRRMRGEPIQYILGKTEFMGLELKVNQDVFIPRPETEILAEKVITLARNLDPGAMSILDIGTGSGCIAVSLARFIKNAIITAIDISSEALKTAEENARLNSVADKIKFIQSDLFASHELRFTAYDIIISNPPYIPSGEIKELQPEIQYEPPMALNGGKDGLDFYRRIVDKAHYYLKDGGFLAMEMGFNQKDAIKNILQRSGYFEIIDSIKDYNNIDRVIIAQKRERPNG